MSFKAILAILSILGSVIVASCQTTDLEYDCDIADSQINYPPEIKAECQRLQIEEQSAPKPIKNKGHTYAI